MLLTDVLYFFNQNQYYTPPPPPPPPPKLCLGGYIGVGLMVCFFCFFHCWSVCCFFRPFICRSVRFSCLYYVLYWIFPFNLSPYKPWFLLVCSTSLLITLLEKEKLLIMSNFSFSHLFSIPLENFLPVFMKFEIVVYKLFHFGHV